MTVTEFEIFQDAFVAVYGKPLTVFFALLLAIGVIVGIIRMINFGLPPVQKS